MMEFCIWIDKSQANSAHYVVYAARVINEPSESIWLKFIFCCFVSFYVGYGLWTNYYAHYGLLVMNLSTFGLSKDYLRYDIVVGDPAYAILSDPIVSIAMVIDIWWSMFYVTFGVMRVIQLQDFAVYFNAVCIFLAMCGLRILSCEPYPGLLAIVAYIYSGPIITLLGTTRLVGLFYFLWKIGLPAELYYQGTESVSVVSFITVLMSTLPLSFSWSISWWRRRKTNRVEPFHARKLSGHMSHYTYNDMKAFILFLHELYEMSPRYRKLPLYSHRAADCFILCYKADGHLDSQVRLSLLSCLDLQPDDPDWTIWTCKAKMHSNCVCLINSNGCDGSKMEIKSSELILHRGDLNCQRVL
ncbi:hypothetical protein LEN26_016166 [Aphanomyces euteiches]|nr:hypothetical protein LEN26_016166 [Aphanomyces euteiches]KAH9109180.1 hypothetical protein AeMF1_015711 [Aphanomyces euteiches]KAH9190143.1 hypothetical protein AeNC1_007881 [Aphanomyces euteiches]